MKVWIFIIIVSQLSLSAGTYNVQYLRGNRVMDMGLSTVREKQVEQPMTAAHVEALLAPWVGTGPILQVVPDHLGSMARRPQGLLGLELVSWLGNSRGSQLAMTEASVPNHVPMLAGTSPSLFTDLPYEPLSGHSPLLLVVEMDPCMLLRAGLPRSLERAIKQALGDTLSNHIAQRFRQGKRNQIHFSCAVHGGVGDGSYRLLFQGLMIDILNLVNGVAQRNMLMGVFDLDGLTPGEQLGQDVLVTDLVCYRDLHTFVPNKARVVVSKERSLASFWSVGLIKDADGDDHLLVTFHLVVQRQDLVPLFSQPQTDLMKRLVAIQQALRDAGGLTRSDDQRAFRSLYGLLKRFYMQDQH